MSPRFWRGSLFGLLFVAPFWIAVGYLIWRWFL